MAEKLLYVGLDRNEKQPNLELARRLAGSVLDGNFGFKINLDHALMWGEGYIKEVVDTGKDVFVDLKMNNGPRTMGNIIRWLGKLCIAHTNVWAHSESNLAKTVADLKEETDTPAVLGVTFYSRWDEAYAQKHHRMSLGDLISHWAQTAVDNGADGIILPANHLNAVADLNIPKLCPAIRLAGETTASRQVQTNSPYEAIVAGADMLVVGSPIHAAQNPEAALQKYLGEIARAESEIGG